MKIVTGTNLYKLMRALSKGSHRAWIASPYLGRAAHNVFDPTFPWARDKRLLTDLRSGYIYKDELDYLMKWASGSTRKLPRLHAKLYIFDAGAIVTSANLTLGAFQTNREVGVALLGDEATAARSMYSQMYAKAKTVTPSDLMKLPKPKSSLGGSGQGAGAKHTDVDIWDEEVPNASGDEDDGLDETVAGPTFEAASYSTDLFSRAVQTELKRNKIRRVNWFVPPEGLKATRKRYPTGAVFDSSEGVGAKRSTWALGARRSIAMVKDVIPVKGRAVIVARTLVSYKVDGALLKGAKKRHIFSGHPNSFEILSYRDQVVKRKKSRASK